MDNADIIADFSRKVMCTTRALLSFVPELVPHFWELDIDRALRATAAFAGLVAYAKGLETVPFVFSSDITYYQSILKDSFAIDPKS